MDHCPRGVLSLFLPLGEGGGRQEVEREEILEQQCEREFKVVKRGGELKQI